MPLILWIDLKYLLMKSCHSYYSSAPWPIKFERMATDKYIEDKYNFRYDFTEYVCLITLKIWRRAHIK